MGAYSVNALTGAVKGKAHVSIATACKTHCGRLATFALYADITCILLLRDNAFCGCVYIIAISDARYIVAFMCADASCTCTQA